MKALTQFTLVASSTLGVLHLHLGSKGTDARARRRCSLLRCLGRVAQQRPGGVGNLGHEAKNAYLRSHAKAMPGTFTGTSDW